jgi:hypothetical protein
VSAWPAIARSVHPLKVSIVEAMEWVGEPLSPAELVRVLDRTAKLGTVAYHVKRLEELGALELSHTRPVRGALEHFYAVAGRP